MTLISQYKIEIRTPRKYPENIEPCQKKVHWGHFFLHRMFVMHVWDWRNAQHSSKVQSIDT